MRLGWLLLLVVGCSGDDESETDTGPDGPEPFAVALGDPEDCGAFGKVAPKDASEVGHWVAGRLTPPYWPARVDEITAAFDARIPCTATIPGKMYVVIAGETLPSDPEIRYFGEVQSGGSQGQIMTLEVPELYLEDGEHLYVMSQAEGTESAMRCMSLCQDEDQPDLGWWSNASEPPYSWTTLGSRGEFGALAISMKGEAPVVVP